MISPLRYPGGKAKLYPYFVELVRLNNLYNCVYCEPYAGGAGLALKLLSHGFVASIEINDIDPAIYSFWRFVLEEPDRFCSEIERSPLTVDEWIRQREIYKTHLNGWSFELGFAAYYLNRTSRSGIIEGSGPIGGYKQGGDWKIDARMNKKAQIEQISQLSTYSKSIKVTNLDAVEFCLLKFNDENSFVYLDPPYYVKGSKLYKNFYKHEDHEMISEMLKTHINKRWLLSYDFAPQIVDMYRPLEPIIYDLPYSAGQSGRGKEVIFTGTALALPETRYLPRAA